jgi:hypothetical protein
VVRVIVRSRFGNRVLAFLGAVYFVSAFATLVYYVVTNWGANRLTDLVLQAALLGAAIAGVFFVLIAIDNLKTRHQASRRLGSGASAAALH